MDGLTAQPSASDKPIVGGIHDDMAALLRLPQGRRVLMWVLQQCGVYHSIFTGDDAATNFNLGRRDIGLRVLSMIESVDREAYPRLLLMAAQEQKEAVHVADAGETD